MLSVDRRLIVRRVAVRTGGREERHRYNSSYCSSTSAPASQRKHTHTHTLCYTQLVSCTRRHMLQPHTAHTYMALTGTWGGASGLMDCLECVVWRGQAGVSAQSNLTKRSEEDKRAGQCPGETQNFSRRLGLFENPGKRQKNPVFAFGILLLFFFIPVDWFLWISIHVSMKGKFTGRNVSF